MKTKVYNLNGKSVGEVDVPDAFFARPWNADLVHQAVVTQQANRRRPVAHSRDRSEVSGGGRKPWRQKGTGRARHGSTRSPLWVGGGVTHGPRNTKVTKKKINKKMQKAALYSALSKRFKDGEVKVVDSLALSSPKTKELAIALKNFSNNVLLVPASENKGVVRAARNIPKVGTVRPDSLNIESVLKHKNILIDQSAIAEMK